MHFSLPFHATGPSATSRVNTHPGGARQTILFRKARTKSSMTQTIWENKTINSFQVSRRRGDSACFLQATIMSRGNCIFFYLAVYFRMHFIYFLPNTSGCPLRNPALPSLCFIEGVDNGKKIIRWYSRSDTENSIHTECLIASKIK